MDQEIAVKKPHRTFLPAGEHQRDHVLAEMLDHSLKDIEDPHLVVVPGSQVMLDGEVAVPVLLEVLPPKGAVRMNIDVCLVVDISGSMGTEATIQSSTGATESHGLSLLDIAKHGVRTVVASLGPDDRFSLVWFNSQAGIALKLIAMDEDGKTKADEQLNALEAQGGTNIWEGLELGLNSLSEPSPGRMSHLMLLTDGQTQLRDHVLPRLGSHKAQHEQLPCISTFGFGYSIDSQLLTGISTVGDGAYSFIPDAGFVGTVFVNTVSNLMVTFAKETFIQLEANNCEVIHTYGQYAADTSTSPGITRIKLGTMQHQQRRSVVVAVKLTGGDAELGANLSYRSAAGETKDGAFVEVTLKSAILPATVQQVGLQLHRCLFVEAIAEVGDMLADPPSTKSVFPDMRCEDDSYTKAQGRLQSYVQSTRRTPVANDEFVKALLEDATGQAAEAVSCSDWYRKWGVHYLPSLKFAHQMQQCNNFKDPGVQGYGGELFNLIRDSADDKFNSIPPPKPTARNSSHSSGFVSSMSAYNNCYGG